MIPPRGPIELCYDLKEVQVFDTKGKEIDKKRLAELLKDESVAVASFGDQQPDPLHLRILKEGTLVFILPPPPAEKMPLLGAIRLPDGDEALLPELEPETVSVLFIRKRTSVADSDER